MTVIALINPQSLLGEEIKQELGRRPHLKSDVRLLATAADQVGAITEFAGNAAVVQGCDAENLAAIDLAILLPGGADSQPGRLSLPPGSALVVVDPESEWSDATPVVAGLDSKQGTPGKTFISPPPPVIMLALLLQPLLPLGLSRAMAQMLLPASTRGQGGLDELFEQTRSILTMRAEKPTAVFGKQMAFNLLPASADRDRNLVLLRRLLGGACEVALQLVQAGVFHSLACGLFVQFDTDPGIEQLRTALASNPAIDIAEQGDRPGPTDAAAREEILVADLLASSSTPGSYQLWAVMDNLTRGGVLNLMEIVESLVVPGS